MLLKISDYGFCKKIGEQYQTMEIGTRTFNAPEQLYKEIMTDKNYLKDSTNTQKQDIFSLGYVYYYLIHNEYPNNLNSYNDKQCQLKSVDELPGIKNSQLASIKHDLNKLLFNMFQFEYEKRFDIN